ncbi:MAG: hypothetical protein AB1345_14240 [Chloroflexota bacterium]
MLQAPRQQLELKQQATAHLAQTMALLMMPAPELQQQIEAQLAANPALELIQEKRCPYCNRVLPREHPCPVCTYHANAKQNEAIVFVSFDSGGGLTYSPDEAETDDDLPYEPLGAAAEDLPKHILQQIAPDLDHQDQDIAVHILHSLNSNGLLTINLLDICQYHHVPPSRVEKVLHLIQRANPIGVGSQTPKEALLIQLEVLAETQPVPPLAKPLIQEGLSLLSQHKYTQLAEALNTTPDEIEMASRYIADNLNPYPAQAHWGKAYTKNQIIPHVYYQPDIIISFLNDDPTAPLVVEIVMPLGGSIRVNPEFRAALADAPEEKKEQWKKAIEKGSLFAKCVRQRNHTLVRLMKQLVAIQRDFILHGETHLRPLTRASISERLEVHESTISRAVADKVVLLPNKRMVPLAIFFDRNLHLRTLIKQLIRHENEPLSDTDIVEILSDEGFHIARRTVAKYRNMENIPPLHMRRAKRGPTK